MSDRPVTDSKERELQADERRPDEPLPEGRADEHYEVSVVIPTYNRLDTLPEVLQAVLMQRDVVRAELIVVNDGSASATREFLDNWLAEHHNHQNWNVRVVHQDNAGPAAARNEGVRTARGRLVAFLGDDTVPNPGWLGAHLDRHQRAAEEGLDPARIGVIGYTGWHARMQTNPFLDYINEYGLQFGYELIEDPNHVPFNFFYTSNLSVPRQALLAEPFDVEFPYAAWEDIEVAYRLHQVGFRLLYQEEAVVAHDHPTSLSRFADRQEKAGFCAVVFFRKHKELGELLGLGREGPPAQPGRLGHQLRWWLVRTLQGIAERTGWSWCAPVALSPVWEESLRYYYIAGLQRAWRELSEPTAAASG